MESPFQHPKMGETSNQLINNYANCIEEFTPTQILSLNGRLTQFDVVYRYFFLKWVSVMFAPTGHIFSFVLKLKLQGSLEGFRVSTAKKIHSKHVFL